MEMLFTSRDGTPYVLSRVRPMPYEVKNLDTGAVTVLNGSPHRVARFLQTCGVVSALRLED